VVDCNGRLLKALSLIFHTMSNSPQNNNYYWYNGAFCENCGIITGNTSNHGGRHIWYGDCKPGCNTKWDYKDFCPSNDYKEACAYRELMRVYFLREAEYEKEEEEKEEEESDAEGSFEGDNFDDYFDDQDEVPEPEQVLLWTTVDGKDYIKCEKTGTIYDFSTYKDRFELVILGKWCEKTKKINFDAKKEARDCYPGEYLPGFNPHTDTKSYRLH